MAQGGWPLAVAPSFGWLAALLVVWAAANSVIDVAMNAAGVELEERAGRPLLSRLHASQSGGLVALLSLEWLIRKLRWPLPATAQHEAGLDDHHGEFAPVGSMADVPSSEVTRP